MGLSHCQRANKKRQTFTLTIKLKSCQFTCPPNACLWIGKKPEDQKKNPQRHRENMQTLHIISYWLSGDSNPVYNSHIHYFFKSSALNNLLFFNKQIFISDIALDRWCRWLWKKKKDCLERYTYITLLNLKICPPQMSVNIE